MGDDLRQRLLAAAPSEVERLDADERERFLLHGERLVHATTWEGARGVEVTDEMIDVVAAHAALLAAGFEPHTQPFARVDSVVLHAGTIVNRSPRPGPARGTMTTTPQYLAGQSGHGHGPVLLDWRTVVRHVGSPQRGENVVYHEFAHKLDQIDGEADGRPPVGDAGTSQAWAQTMGTNFRRLQRRGSDPLIRRYGATSPAEFFAVTSELFFTRPVDLRATHPRVYDRLAGFYRQDPAGRRVSDR